MSLTQKNLFMVVTLEDLLHLLRESKGKHVALSVVIDETPDEIKSMIKRFIKVKSKIFTNVLFLYFIAKPKYFGRPDKIIPKDKSLYPAMHFIYNVEHLLASIMCINKLSELEANFKECIEDDYIKHKQKLENNLNDDDKDNEYIEDEKTSHIESHGTVSNVTKQNVKPVDDQKESLIKAATMLKDQMKIQEDNNKMELNNKKKLLDKLLLLKDKSLEYQMKFAEDILDRKKREERKAKHNN